MTNPTTWHAPTELLERFAAHPAALDAASAASLEAHLVACADCRAALADAAGPELAAGSWAVIADRIDRPRESALEWLLRHLGVRSGPARLVAATPGLRLSGLAAVAGLTAAAVVAARSVDAGGPFLLVAPLVPLTAVALTFAAVADPAGEAGIATPVHGAGLALRRAAAVLVLAFAVLVAGALAVPGLGSVPLAWVLPAIALAAGSLALGTWIRVELAVAGLATAWIVAAAILRYADRGDTAFADAVPFTAVGQVGAAALAALAIVVLTNRADRYATLEARV